MSKPAGREPARLKYGNSQGFLADVLRDAAVSRDVDFRVLLAFHGLRVMVFVAPFGFGFAAFVSVGTAFAGKASCLPPLPF